MSIEIDVKNISSEAKKLVVEIDTRSSASSRSTTSTLFQFYRHTFISTISKKLERIVIKKSSYLLYEIVEAKSY